MKVTKIKMKPGCRESKDLCEIDAIYIDSLGVFIKKEQVYDYLLVYPKSICVDIYPYPYLQPALSIKGEKFVRSTADFTKIDNLFNLPKV